LSCASLSFRWPKLRAGATKQRTVNIPSLLPQALHVLNRLSKGSAANHTLTLPEYLGGGEIAMDILVRELVEEVRLVRRGVGKQVSKDRLTRIAALSKRAKEQLGSAAAVEGEVMGGGSDVALCLEDPPGSGKYKLWFGRVIIMKSPINGKLRTLDWYAIHHIISLVNTAHACCKTLQPNP
jgi:hypothetical protein